MLLGIKLPFALLFIAGIYWVGQIWSNSQSSVLKLEDLPKFTRVTLDGDSGIFVGIYEVTHRQWMACVYEGGCPELPTQSEPKPDHPVTGVNWYDVQNYISWHGKTTGINARLPSRDEWLQLALEHAPKKKRLLFSDPRLSWAARYDLEAGPRERLPRSKGAFGVNKNGIYDFKGNVWEWTSSICKDPEINDEQNCRSGRYAMGEHEAILSKIVRNPGNASCGAGLPPSNLGFRLVYKPI